MPSARKLLAGVAAALLVAAVAAGQTAADFRSAMDAAYRQDYQLAWQLLDRLPEDLPGTLFSRACLLQSVIFDSGDKGLVDSFYRMSDRAAARCRSLARARPDDPAPHFYLALTELNRANLLSWQQRKLSAFATLLKVMPNLNRARRLDPGLTDAMFGQGVIEYFKSTANRYVLGLRVFGSRPKAYELLRNVQRDGCLLQPSAEFMLGFMMKEDRDYAGAFDCCRRMLAAYPGNLRARRLLRDVSVDAGEHELAIEVGRELWADIDSVWPRNYYGMAENWLKMARAFELLNEPDSARRYAEYIIAWEPWQAEVPWLPNYVREAKQLKARLRR